MGVDVFVGGSVPSPQMALSCARSLTEYTLDLYEIPDKVEEALWAALPELIASGIAGCRATGSPCVALILERGSGQLYPLTMFEKFEWPMLKKMIDEFVAHGITPLLHLDTDWSRNLPYFKQFPHGKVVASFDGTTDLFNAKQVIGDHVCIMGDVPASLLVAGTTDEVETYVGRLCDEVGRGGGFILGTGCSMPPNARYENVKTMIETCRSRAR
jgi:uroporphyrinogen-III decarboxylase